MGRAAYVTVSVEKIQVGDVVVNSVLMRQDEVRQVRVYAGLVTLVLGVGQVVRPLGARLLAWRKEGVQ